MGGLYLFRLSINGKVFSYIVQVINMKSASFLMKNTLLLTGCNITLRLFALCFQAYLAANIGPGQLGIFGIITSVGVVFSTISISGVRFSVTRLTAEEVSCGNAYPGALMCSAFRYAAVFGLLAGAGMYFSAPFLSEHYIGDIAATVPLKIMSAAMPAIAFSACIEGYFTAKQKVFRLIAAQLVSQGCRMAFAVIMLNVFLERGVFPPDILAEAFFVGETIFAVGLFILYFAETRKRKIYKKGNGTYGMSKLVKTAAPLAVSAYMRTGLSSVGQVIIPAGLRKSGMASAGAFSVYGTITQMAMPVVMFPAALLSAMGDILIPRLTAAQVGGKRLGISYIVNRSLRLGTVFSAGVMGVMLFYADILGEAVYKSTQAGMYIKIFAPLVPIVYIDCVTDGCLKGLGQQVYSMVYNVLEGIINVVLLYLFLPRAAMAAYIAVVYIKECFNASLSLHRLSKVTSVRLEWGVILCVMICICGAWLLGEIMAFSGVAAKIITYCVLYVVLLYLFNAVTRDDIKWVASLFRNNKI